MWWTKDLLKINDVVVISHNNHLIDCIEINIFETIDRTDAMIEKWMQL
jgi:hypothetical protein